MESIDALANAVNQFEGGLVLVSHDMRLISQVAKEIWICDHKTVAKYKGDIQNFKMDMRNQMGIEGEMKGQLRGDASVMNKKDEVKVKDQESAKSTSSAPVKKTTQITKKVVASVKKEDSKPNSSADTWGEEMTPLKSQTPAKSSLSSLTSLSSSLPSNSTSSASTGGKYVPPHKAANSVRGKYVPPHLRNRS